MPPEYEVMLTHAVERDLDTLHAYVAETRGADAADRLLDLLLQRIETLERFPNRGVIPRELDRLGIAAFRQILADPYRIVYRVIDRRVVIVLLADGRRDMQTLLEQRLLGR